MNKTIIEGIKKIAVAAIGIGATLITDWVDEKKMNEKIEEKVNEALARKEYGKES